MLYTDQPPIDWIDRFIDMIIGAVIGGAGAVFFLLHIKSHEYRYPEGYWCLEKPWLFIIIIIISAALLGGIFGPNIWNRVAGKASRWW